MKRNWRHLIIVAATLALIGLPQSAFALADPDVIRIESVNRYDDVAVTGDLFILVEYTLNYTVLPPENVSQGWVGRLIDVGGAGQLAAVSPFAGHDIPNLGYSRGTYGFYFQTAPAISGTLRVTLEGNPALSPTPTGIYTESITTAASSSLATELRAQGIRFEDIWDVDLISPVSGGVNRYTSDGEHYFSSALPNLRRLAPDLFVLQSIQPEIASRNSDSSFGDSRAAIWDGTVVAIGFAGIASFLGVSDTIARFLVAFLGAGVVVVLIGLAEPLKGLEWLPSIQGMAWYLCMFAGFWFGMVIGPVLGLLLIVPVVIIAVQVAMNRSNL